MAGSLQRATWRRCPVKLTRVRRAGKALGLVLPIIAGTFGTAHAQHLTGERFYEICHDQASTEWQVAGQRVCPSFIRGLIDGARLQVMRDAAGAPAGQAHRPMICDPQTASAQDAITLVLQYLEASPETRPLPAAVVVTQALGKAWPCER
ncbi:Rap1a/Tai family immunity protein [Methylobacterium sp. E-066]|uniref:Rap1a/Tai family immunity protein n=1 Tax=Methylobacterium sp. E-066 TaxID=2836584 RepID=UPI001FBB805A|nr:Rap1a/Tai family immunity protein [Methylobacterium sp. E-066]MCJ2140269.1 hypothetical protein [Methylobacterium sp. E-066]